MAVLGQEVLVGNVGNIFEKRVVGKDSMSVIDFTVAVTPRKRDGDKWVDGITYWASCTAWGRLADNIEKSFRQGDRVFIMGRIDMKPSWTNKEGQEMPERPFINVDYAGLEVTYNAAESKRVKNGGGASKPAPAKKEAPAKKKPEPEVSEDEDFDLDFSEFEDGGF